jgi:hypothetical protein
MAQRCACLVLVALQRSADPISTLDLAKSIAEARGNSGRARIQTQIEYMINAGGRYENLERAVGPSTPLFLGVDYPETSYGYSFPHEKKKSL